jgi:hypothetical protein
VLWDRGYALIDQELEVVVVQADEERPAPKVRPPVANSLNKADEFTLVSRQLGMLTRNQSIEECHHTVALMYYGVESGARSVTLDNEFLVEDQ